MKRTFEVEYSSTLFIIRISGEIEAAPGQYVRGEVDTIRNNLADAAMRALSSGPYVNAPLCKIKVK